MNCNKSLTSRTILGTLWIVVIIMQLILAAVYELNCNLFFVANLIFITIFLYPSINTNIKLFGWIYSIVLLALLKIQLVRFDFIPQARTLLEGNTSILYWLSSGHVHAIRLLIAYPGYLFSVLLGVDVDQGFTYYALSLFAVIYMSISNVLYRIDNIDRADVRNIRMIMLFIPLLMLPLIMNGRIIFAYVGYCILIEMYMNLYSGIKIGTLKATIITIAGLIMTMVSSGTMMVAIVYVMSMICILNYGNFKKKIFLKNIFLFILALFPIMYSLFKYILIMLNRNIAFFGGGVGGAIKMLNHGMGRFLILNKSIAIGSLIIGVFIVIYNYNWIKKNVIKKERVLPILLGMNVAAYGLLFGFSTGLMLIPPLLIYVLIKIK